MLCQWGYRDLQVLAICLAQVLAGRRINFEGLAFASKAILRQNMSDPATCQLCLPFPLNNSKTLKKTLKIPLTHAPLFIRPSAPRCGGADPVPPPNSQKSGCSESTIVSSQRVLLGSFKKTGGSSGDCKTKHVQNFGRVKTTREHTVQECKVMLI